MLRVMHRSPDRLQTRTPTHPPSQMEMKAKGCFAPHDHPLPAHIRMTTTVTNLFQPREEVAFLTLAKPYLLYPPPHLREQH